MTQRNSHRRLTEMIHPATVVGSLPARGEFLISLPLVLLIINGGAG